MYCFHKRNEIGVIIDVDDKDALSFVLPRVWMLNNIQQLAFFNVKDNLLWGRRRSLGRQPEERGQGQRYPDE